MTEESETKFWKDLRSGKFAQMVKEETRGHCLDNPKGVFNIMKPLFAEIDDIERLFCLFLNKQNQIIAIENLFNGTLSNVYVYPREIVKRVLDLKAGAVVMVHNHVSGNTKPSDNDLEVTRKVALALMSIDVLFHDHIIVGNGYYSFSESGIMEKLRNTTDKFMSGRN